MATAHILPDTSLPLIESSVGDALRQTVARFPDRRAIAWADGEGLASLSYADLFREAEQAACWLLQQGEPGDRVAIWSRNSVEWVIAEYGCALAGMVIASWNPGWTDYECDHALNLSTPALVLAGHDTRGVSLLERAQDVAGAVPVFPIGQLRQLAATASAVELPRPLPTDLFLLQFTSGTTGRAKGASLSHRTALNSAALRFRGIGADDSDVWINPSPFSHMGGAITILLGNMVTGGCYVVMNRFDAGEMLRLMRLTGATRIGGVPTMLLSLLEHPGWTPGEFAIRSVGSGGAQVPQPLIERLTEGFNAPVLVAYAQSECPMITSSSLGDEPRLLAETVGRPSAHVELKIVDPQSGRTLELGQVGEVCVRGPIVMDGYYRMPEATAQTIDSDHFLHTGDLGSLDADGYVRIHGRARDVIIRGGENIYPAEVEDALLQHPDIMAVAVVGVPDERWGQQVGAAIQLRHGASLPAAGIETYAAERLSHFKVPRHWKFVDSFPLTPSGKIRKVDVESWFDGDQQAA